MPGLLFYFVSPQPLYFRFLNDKDTIPVIIYDTAANEWCAFSPSTTSTGTTICGVVGSFLLPQLRSVFVYRKRDVYYFGAYSYSSLPTLLSSSLVCKIHCSLSPSSILLPLYYLLIMILLLLLILNN